MAGPPGFPALRVAHATAGTTDSMQRTAARTRGIDERARVVVLGNAQRGACPDGSVGLNSGELLRRAYRKERAEKSGPKRARRERRAEKSGPRRAPEERGCATASSRAADDRCG